MEKIGIIAAMPEEMAEIKRIMIDISEISFFEKQFIVGKIHEKECVLALCGIGKVNAARTTQILIDKFDCKKIINVGSAGALTEGQNIGDIIISTAAVQSDFDITAFGREKGFITGVGKYIEADKYLIDVFYEAIKSMSENIEVRKGIVATADMFVSSAERKIKIGKEFNALCCEMEGAAMAQVCYLCNVPFVILRSVSDDLYSKAEIDFEKFLKVASVKCAGVLSSALKILN